MKVLIFDSEISGHHLEYVNNIYQGCDNYPNVEFIFVIPKINFRDYEYEWKEIGNASFRFLNDGEQRSIKKGLIKRCLSESILIKKICKELNIDKLILINLAPVVPILPLLLPNTITVIGIIYHIYLWQPKGSIRNWIDRLRYKILAKKMNVKKILILNDRASADKFNTIFKTSKFKRLPDPLPNIPISKMDLKNKYNINSDHIVFLHFGSLNWRKGTIDILQAIKLLSVDSKYTFIFAGKVSEDIKEEFYSLYNDLCKDYSIVLIDEFCSYSYINSLCGISHCILMPYHISSQSSGVLGHASAHHIPVIGPSSGLIGQLIQDNKLGIGIERISPNTIACAIKDFVPYTVSASYAKKNSLEEFRNILLN